MSVFKLLNGETAATEDIVSATFWDAGAVDDTTRSYIINQVTREKEKGQPFQKFDEDTLIILWKPVIEDGRPKNNSDRWEGEDARQQCEELQRVGFKVDHRSPKKK